MGCPDLDSYIARLEQNGDLVRITAPVDPLLEIAAITDQVCKEPGGGRALLFENPRGSKFPLAANLFGSERRVCLALGRADLAGLGSRLRVLLEQVKAPEFSRLDRQIAALPEFAAFAPLTARTGCRSELCEMEPPDVTRFPFLQSWPGDGSAEGYPRYITLGQTYSRNPSDGSRNCGLYRIQVRGAREVAIQWKPGSGAARHAEEYRRRGAPMPVAIVLGGDPALLFSAMFPLPGDLDEVTFAGFLRGEACEVEPCRSVPLEVPCGAEAVIEGWCQPEETVLEGPFGNHTGRYSPAAPAQLMRVSAVRHRRRAIIPATLVGPPPMEDCWMAGAWERLLAAFLNTLFPAVVDIHFPQQWVFHQSAIISLEKPSPGMVREIAGQLWKTTWFGAARLIIFVDAAIRPAHPSAVAWQAINVTNYADDIIWDTTAQRLAIDATGCRTAAAGLCMPAELRSSVERRWQEYGLG